MKNPTTLKSAFVWGISLIGLFVLLSFVNWFVYPLKSASPNFKDVETVFNSIKIPNDWVVVDQSENRGIAGRQCPIESDIVCFSKSKTFKVDYDLSNEMIVNVFKTSGCGSVSVTDLREYEKGLYSKDYVCMSGLVYVSGTLKDTKDGQTVSIRTRSK